MSIGNRTAHWGLTLGIGLVAFFCGQGVALATPDSQSSSGAEGSAAVNTHRAASPAARAGQRPGRVQPAAAQDVVAAPESLTPESPAPRQIARTAHTRSVVALSAASVDTESFTPATTVTVDIPSMPVEQGTSFTVSRDAIAGVAADYVAAGGDPSDNPRFFFGDLAVRSLGALAGPQPAPDQVRTDLGNLAVSGYFGGVWLRDNLRDAPATAASPSGTVTAVPVDVGTATAAKGLSTSAIGIRLFDTLAASLTGLATSRQPGIVTTAARASVPVLLTLYGYNRGYLQFLLENPPAGVPSMQDTLSCKGFLDCNSSAFPLEIANRYDTALADLASPPSQAWREMGTWTTLLEGATGTGRFVWGLIAQAGAFSPASYGALVDLSSAYLMVSKAAVLSSMLSYADGNPELGRSALRLQAGLWMWSGAYFAGLASDAPRGTIPTIVTS